jgi:hypothetical protein
MTESVYRGFKAANPSSNTLTEDWGWKVQDCSVVGYSGQIYGADMIKTAFK